MPITYESAAPVAAAANIYEQEARINAQRQQAMAAAASSGYGHQAQVPYDTGIQDAINHRDNAQFAVQRDNADRQAAFGLQNQKFQLEAQLSTMQLTQQENMRLARMKNAVGDVQNDKTLSDAEKAEMTLQLKTGIDPLIHRQSKAKLAMDQQLKEQQAEQYQAQAALKNQEAIVTAKTADERTSFLPDKEALAKISDDISQNADLPAMIPQQRDALIQKMALEEATRQGLGHHVFQEGYGKWKILSGAGSDADKASGKTGGKPGQDHPTGLSPMDYLKAREQAENQAHKEQQMQVEGDIPGEKKHVHPQSVEWKQERVRQIMGGLGLPADMTEYNKQKTATAQSGYNPSKAAWNKNKQPAAAVTPAGQGAQQQTSQTTTVTAINKRANEQANAVLQDSRIQPEMRTQMAEKIGYVRRTLEEAGGDPNRVPANKKEEFQAALKFLDDNDPDKKPPEAAQAQKPGYQPSLGEKWNQNVEGFANRFTSGLGEVEKGAGNVKRGILNVFNPDYANRRKRVGER